MQFHFCLNQTDSVIKRKHKIKKNVWSSCAILSSTSLLLFKHYITNAMLYQVNYRASLLNSEKAIYGVDYLFTFI